MKIAMAISSFLQRAPWRNLSWGLFLPLVFVRCFPAEPTFPFRREGGIAAPYMVRAKSIIGLYLAFG
jgi:hypothetical protein